MATYDKSLTATRTKMHAVTAVDWIAMAILIIGGINWGLVGLVNTDLVAMLFGEMTGAARAVYVAVGLAALYAIYMMVRMSSDSKGVEP